MTTRERFRRVMAGDAAVDRLPAIEWAYWWDKTLELWYGQGLPRGLDEAAMADFVGIDPVLAAPQNTGLPPGNVTRQGYC
mgnify:CR=1 FL=1